MQGYVPLNPPFAFASKGWGQMHSPLQGKSRLAPTKRVNAPWQGRPAYLAGLALYLKHSGRPGDARLGPVPEGERQAQRGSLFPGRAVLLAGQLHRWQRRLLLLLLWPIQGEALLGRQGPPPGAKEEPPPGRRRGLSRDALASAQGVVNASPPVGPGRPFLARSGETRLAGKSLPGGLYVYFLKKILLSRLEGFADGVFSL